MATLDMGDYIYSLPSTAFHWQFKAAQDTQEGTVDKELETKAAALVKAETEAALVPFPKLEERIDGDGCGHTFTRCPKCGSEIGRRHYCAETDRAPEYVSWECECGFVLKTEPQNAE